MVGGGQAFWRGRVLNFVVGSNFLVRGTLGGCILMRDVSFIVGCSGIFRTHVVDLVSYGFVK